MKWINCFEAMPKKHEKALVFGVYANGNTFYTLSWIGDDGWAMGSAKGFTITHWMRIEEPR